MPIHISTIHPNRNHSQQGFSPSVYYTAFLAPPHLTVIHTYYSVKQRFLFSMLEDLSNVTQGMEIILGIVYLNTEKLIKIKYITQIQSCSKVIIYKIINYLEQNIRHITCTLCNSFQLIQFRWKHARVYIILYYAVNTDAI